MSSSTDPIEQLRSELEAAQRQLKVSQTKQKRLSDELNHMVKAQGNLYRFQEKIEQQKIIYAQIAEVGHRFNESLDFKEILNGLDRFIIDLLNFERFVFLLSDSSGENLVHSFHGGYHGDELNEKIRKITLSQKDKLFQTLLGGKDHLVIQDNSKSEDELIIKSTFLMNEFFVLSLGREDRLLRGVLIIGNSQENLQLHQRVKADDEIMALFANFTSQLAAALNTLKFMQGIQHESTQVKRLLNNMRQAVFSVNAQGEIVEPVSRFSENIFGSDPVGKNVFELIFSHLKKSEAETHSKLMTAFHTVFGEGEIQWELMEDQFPNRLVYTSGKDSNEKILKLSFRPIWDDNELLEKIMFVVEDITEIERLAIQINKEREEILVIQELVKNTIDDIRSFFIRAADLMIECYQQAQKIHIDGDEFGSLLRNLHTLKGNARLFSFSLISKKVHGSESVILEVKNLFSRGEKEASETVRVILQQLHEIEVSLQTYAQVSQSVLQIQNQFQKPILQRLQRLLLELDWRESNDELQSSLSLARFYFDLIWTCQSLNFSDLNSVAQRIEKKLKETPPGQAPSVSHTLLLSLKKKSLAALIDQQFFSPKKLDENDLLQIFLGLKKLKDCGNSESDFHKHQHDLLVLTRSSRWTYLTDQIEHLTHRTSPHLWMELWNYLGLMTALRINQALDSESKTQLKKTFEKKLKASEKNPSLNSTLQPFHSLLTCLEKELPNDANSDFDLLIEEALGESYQFKKIMPSLRDASDEAALRSQWRTEDIRPWISYLFRHLYGDISLQGPSIQNLYLRISDLLEILKNYDRPTHSDESSMKTLEIPDVHLSRLRQSIESFENTKNTQAIEKIKRDFRHLFDVPLKPILFKFQSMIDEISSKLQKKVLFQVTGEDISLETSRVDSLKDALVHIIRNSLDHGLELPDERVRLRKKEVGLIEIQCLEKDAQLELIITDDGRGIDPERVSQVALKKNLLSEEELRSMTNQQKQELIFRPGFSTKKEANEISGRGMGMDIVLNLITDLGGKLELQSRPGHGTEILIRLPNP